MKVVSSKAMRNWYGLDVQEGEPFDVPAHLTSKAEATECLKPVRGRPKKVKADDEDLDGSLH